MAGPGNHAMTEALARRCREPAHPSSDRGRGDIVSGFHWPLTTERVRAAVNREPFPFQHDLDQCGLFATEALALLCRKYAGHDEDYFVSRSAGSAGEEFYAASHGTKTPQEAFAQLDADRYRILLKRPEKYDPAFAVLLEDLTAEIGDRCGCFDGRRILRAESAIFISSAATITPFHFDPEMAFFCQIEGEKHYHIYSPAAVSERELELFYRGGVLSIAQLDLETRPTPEIPFRLTPGTGLHQPQNAPHWVETAAARSVSYSIVFETDASHALGRVRAFNHYWRRLGMEPSCPGRHPLLDAGKDLAIRAAFPARKALRRILPRKRH